MDPYLERINRRFDRLDAKLDAAMRELELVFWKVALFSAVLVAAVAIGVRL